MFIAIESRSRTPLVRLGIFRSGALSAANVTMFLLMGGMFVMMFFPTLYMAQVKHWSPIKIGLAYLPWPIAMATAAPFGRRLLQRTAPKIPLVIGLILVAGGLFLLAPLQRNSNYFASVLPGVLLTAVGTGLAWVAIFLIASAGVPQEDSGLASGIINSSLRIGSALGLATISSVAAAYTSHRLSHAGPKPSLATAQTALVDGYGRGFLIGGATVTAAVVVAFVGLRRTGTLHHAARKTVEGELEEVEPSASRPDAPLPATR